MSEATVEIWRGNLPESSHRVDVAVSDINGLIAHAGNPAAVCYARSAIKPLQCIPVLADGAAEAYGFTEEEIALCCASHSGEAQHVEVAQRMLGKLGLEESALACGPHAPFAAEAARELIRKGEKPRRVHNNCSGKHAGMLALASVHGWTTFGYQHPEHPVQQRIAEVVATWAGLPQASIPVGVDGCGVATFGLALEAMAQAFAKLSAASEESDGPASRAVAAMMNHPFMVGGTDRLCTLLIEASEGEVFAKVGAEGVYCAGVPTRGIGLALKVEDGATRASEPVLLGVLHALELLSDSAMEKLARFAYPSVLNTRGEQVGEVRTRIALTRNG